MQMNNGQAIQKSRTVAHTYTTTHSGNQSLIKINNFGKPVFCMNHESQAATSGNGPGS